MVIGLTQEPCTFFLFFLNSLVKAEVTESAGAMAARHRGELF